MRHLCWFYKSYNVGVAFVVDSAEKTFISHCVCVCISGIVGCVCVCVFWGVIVVVKQYALIVEVSALWSGWYLIEVVLGTCFGLHTYFNLKLRCASALVDFAII